MRDFARMLGQCKFKGELLLGIEKIHEICDQVDHRWREGKLTPAATVLSMMQQVAHANVSCAAVRQMYGGVFTAEAFCQARQRLPLEVMVELAQLPQFIADNFFSGRQSALARANSIRDCQNSM